MQTAWTALADPHRRTLVEVLRVRPRPVNELVALVGLSQPGTSKHLRVLREAGLVTVRADAPPSSVEFAHARQMRATRRVSW